MDACPHTYLHGQGNQRSIFRVRHYPLDKGRSQEAATAVACGLTMALPPIISPIAAHCA